MASCFIWRWVNHRDLRTHFLRCFGFFCNRRPPTHYAPWSIVCSCKNLISISAPLHNFKISHSRRAFMNRATTAIEQQRSLFVGWRFLGSQPEFGCFGLIEEKYERSICMLQLLHNYWRQKRSSADTLQTAHWHKSIVEAIISMLCRKNWILISVFQ